MCPMVARRNVFSGSDFAFMCKNVNNLLDIRSSYVNMGSSILLKNNSMR